MPAGDSGRCHDHRPPCADPGVRRGAGRSDSRRDAARPRRSRRPQSRRRERPGGDRHRYRVGRTAGRALRLEGAARDAARVQRRRLSQRDGHHQRSLPAGSRGRHLAGAHARVRSASGTRGHPRSAHRPARHRQLRQLHEVPGAGRARSDRRDGQERRARVRRDRLQHLSHAGADDRAEREPAVQSRGGAALLRSAAARHRDRRRHSTGVGRARGDSHAGAVGPATSGVRCCTTARRRRSKTRSAGTAAKPRWRIQGYRQATGEDRAALLAFLRSL